MQKDMLLERHEIVVVRQHEHVVVEVDDVATLLLRADAQLLAAHHDVVLHAVQRVGEQRRERVQQLHEAQVHLEQFGDGVQRTHQQAVHRAVAQQEHAALYDVAQKLPRLSVKNRADSCLFADELLLGRGDVQNGGQLANVHVREVEKVANEKLDRHRHPLKIRAGEERDGFVLYADGLPDGAVAAPDGVVHDVLVDLVISGGARHNPRVMIPHISRDKVVGLLVQLLDELLEDSQDVEGGDAEGTQTTENVELVVDKQVY